MGCVCCANKGKYHSAGWHRVLPLRDTLLISGFPLKTNEQGVMGHSPGRIPSAELLVSSNAPAGLQVSPGWAEQLHAKAVASPDPPAVGCGRLLPLPHFPWTCLKPDFVICIQNSFACALGSV